MEEDIRTKGMQIKKLEEERKELIQDSDEREGQHSPENELDDNWPERLNSLQSRYQQLLGELSQAHALYTHAQNQLDYISQRRASQVQMMPRLSSFPDSLPARRASQGPLPQEHPPPPVDEGWVEVKKKKRKVKRAKKAKARKRQSKPLN